MSANFFESSHCKRWLLNNNEEDFVMRDRNMDDNAVRHLHTYFIQLIQRVGTLLRLRQRAVATAFVYFKRTYRKYTFIDLHPLLVLTVSVLLASKVEECEVRCRYIIEALIKACENEREVRHEAKKIRVSYMIQCELFILQAFNLDLIIFHPYRPMLDFARDANVSSQAMDIAWKMINDSYYRTDICFSYPPFLIGLGALCVTCSYTEHDITHWLSNLEDVDFSELKTLVKKFGDLYEEYTEQQPTSFETVKEHLRKLWKITPKLSREPRKR